VGPVSLGLRLGYRLLAVPLALVLATSPASTEDVPELVRGIQQVQRGDYEGAVPTLETALTRLEEEKGPDAERARACLYLGIALVALDRRDAAKERFRQALDFDPELRLTPDRFSPKVIGVFEEARRERGSGGASTPKKSRSKTPLLLLGAGAAAAAGIVVVASGGNGPSGGAPSFSGAHFTTPVLVCPNGSADLPLVFAIQLQGSNPTEQTLTIRAVTVVMIIEESPAVPSEVGFASTAPATLTPSSIAPHGQATLLVQSSLQCGNGPGDPARYNEWSGRVTLDTSADVFTVETADRLRVNIP
jgi:Tetratricopeptide repeat